MVHFACLVDVKLTNQAGQQFWEIKELQDLSGGKKKQRSSPLQSREALRSELNYQLQAELHLETTGLLLKIRGANKLPAHSRSSAREAEKKGVVLSNSYFPVSL